MRNLLTFIILFLFTACNNPGKVKFSVCTDVHHDLIHDAKDRLTDFVKEAEKNNVDFIIQLGDFCLPMEKNQPFLDVWNTFEGPGYHVLGNHDMDISPKIAIQDFLGMEKAYYSFDSGDFHFIVLDPNYYTDEGKLVSYSNGNYYGHPEGRSFIPRLQLEWLKNDLAQTEKYTVVFSHQSLEHWGGVKNKDEVRAIFREANREKKKVIACICGHDHQDRHAEIEGVHYIGINSTSYFWGGKSLEYSGRFPKSIEEKYKNLKYTVPYRESVFATIELDKKGIINIKGVQSEFIPPGPKELGAENINYSAGISNRTLEF